MRLAEQEAIEEASAKLKKADQKKNLHRSCKEGRFRESCQEGEKKTSTDDGDDNKPLSKRVQNAGNV